MNAPFEGFGQQSFAFFEELAENNHTEWFHRNRERYERDVTGVFQSLLRTLEPFLLKLNPRFDVSGKTNRSFSRINRDIRFSKDKRPYKSNYYLRVFDRHRDDSADGCFYFGLSAECVTAGFAIYGSWREKKDALNGIFRKRYESERALFVRLLDRTVKRGRFETYWHRQERGEWTQRAGLPRTEKDWRSLQAWVVRKVFLPNARALGGASFPERVAEMFAQLYPLYVFTSHAGPRWKEEVKRRESASLVRVGTNS